MQRRRRPSCLRARLGAAALAAVLAGSLAAPARAAGADAADPRARRTELLLHIAELTDQLDDTQADVVAAQLESTRLADEASAVRGRVKARAVWAYIHGVGLGDAAPQDLAAPAIYLEVAARKERELLDRLRAASAAVAAREEAADDAKQQLQSVAAELDRARGELDTLVAADDARRQAARLAAEEAASQQAAADARRRAQADARRAATDALGRVRAGAGLADGDLLANPDLLPRHREATRKQAELFRRYPFGVLPPGPLPARLAPTGERQSGMASWYGGFFNGRPTASGAIYDQEEWTAASRTLPLGTLIVVSRSGVRVLLLVNDRGPYVDGRVIDLSAAAARALDVGVSPVEIEVVAPL